MPSASRAIRGSGQNGALLKGSSLPDSRKSVTVFINDVREAPEGFNSPFICEIDQVHDCEGWAPNKTAIKALIEKIDDDYLKWRGYEVTLNKVRVRNPQTGQETWGFEVAGVVKSKRKPKPSSVPF